MVRKNRLAVSPQMDNYNILRIIGRGSYGIVYKVKCRTTGKRYALKSHVESREGDVEDSTVRELSCLFALRGHPNVLEMYECFLYRDKLSTLTEYIPYTLKRLIYNGKGCDRQTPLSFVAHFSLQVANALSYMHRINLIHRDLTPSNVLLTKNLTVKVADMGFSRNAVKRMSSGVVTEPYRAPELFLDSHDGVLQYTCTVDMWSLGVMITDAMEGWSIFMPRNKPEPVSTYEIITRSLCPKDHVCASSITWNLNTLMPNVMKCEPARRIVLQLLCFHERERLLAHDLLQDVEWTQLARMTTAEKQVVRKQNRIQCAMRRKPVDLAEDVADLYCHE